VPAPGLLPVARRALAALVLIAAVGAPLPACSVGGASPPGPQATAVASAAHRPARMSGARTVIERRVEGSALVVEVVEGRGGAEASWWVVDGDRGGARTLLAEEVSIGGDHYVHVAAAEGALFKQAAWIHFDRSDPRQDAFLEQHRLGLIEQAALFDAEEGDAVGSDEVVGVEVREGGERLVRLRTGIDVHVRREVLSPAPTVSAPTSLPVVAFPDTGRLVERAG
jgi:hypothetical protein